MMRIARNDRILIVAPGPLIQRVECTLQNSAEVAAHRRNIEIIHGNLGNGPSLQAYYRSGDKTRNRITQRLQGCNESRVVAF